MIDFFRDFKFVICPFIAGIFLLLGKIAFFPNIPWWVICVVAFSPIVGMLLFFGVIFCLLKYAPYKWIQE